MAEKTITLKHSVDGSLADVTSAALSDPTGTYGVRRQSDSSVVVADGTALAKQSTGVYSYTITGLTAGVVYEYWVEWVYGGATHRREGSFTAQAATPAGHYADVTDLEAEFGDLNLDAYSDIDATGSRVNSRIQRALDHADLWIDTAWRDAGRTDDVPLDEDDADFAWMTKAAALEAGADLGDDRQQFFRGAAGAVAQADVEVQSVHDRAQAILDARIAAWRVANPDEATDQAGTLQSVPMTFGDEIAEGDEHSSCIV